MRDGLADELEEFIRRGDLWDDAACGAMVDRLRVEASSTDDPLPARVGGFLNAVRIRNQMGELPLGLACDIEGVVYPRLWKLIEGVRDGMPDGELRTRIEVMNRRLSRLFVEQSAFPTPEIK